MSELLNTLTPGKDYRWRLLTTVSALALLGAVCGSNKAKAADDGSGNPTVWIELGGQLSRLTDGQESLAPAFPNSPPRPSMFSPSEKFERLPLYSIDGTGKISLQSDNSDWVFSASVHYGRSVSTKHVRQQTNPQPYIIHYSTYYGALRTHPVFPIAQKFADTTARNSKHHFVLDFQAGKDVGLGMFSGNGGSSVVNFGVRFAQFGSNSNIALKSDPDWHFKYISLPTRKIPFGQHYHSNAASLRAARSFHGIGPSISWNAAAPLVGNKDSELTFDWGVNAALLFGRQRAQARHQTITRYQIAKIDLSQQYLYTVGTPISAGHARARTIVVPNVGGSVGATWRIANVKASFGYRADFFFGAMDGGIDTVKKENVGFYGPFATISVGLGR